MRSNQDRSFQLPKNALWTGKKPAFRFFCPICKKERRLSFKPGPGVKQVVQTALMTGMVMLLTWNWISWKGVVSGLPIWITMEVYCRLRARAALYCQTCGFDPYLFLRDRKLAQQEIQSYWRSKFKELGLPHPEEGKITPVIDAQVQNSAGNSQTETS